MAGLQETIIRSKRAAIIGQLMETFADPAAQKSLVMDLREAGIISDTTAEMLLEAYKLEAA